MIARYAEGGIRLGFRTRAEVARFFDGPEPVPPGPVTAAEGYGTGQEPPARQESGVCAGVARVP